MHGNSEGLLLISKTLAAYRHLATLHCNFNLQSW